ncbi:MAG: hypothetical protein FWH55_09990 [Oscillospiraceae bacterium]|nr:hypothetical protein [Oscillospiraceae bacterium]
MFLHNLKSQHNEHNRKVEQENALLPDKLGKYLQAVLGDKDKRTVEDIPLTPRSLKIGIPLSLSTPVIYQSILTSWEETIHPFQAEVDYILSKMCCQCVLSKKIRAAHLRNNPKWAAS